jgi:hypothetical protein
MNMENVNMKITTCQNRFEVVVGEVDDNMIHNIAWALLDWLHSKEVTDPDTEAFLEALGPCGK